MGKRNGNRRPTMADIIKQHAGGTATLSPPTVQAGQKYEASGRHDGPILVTSTGSGTVELVGRADSTTIRVYRSVPSSEVTSNGEPSNISIDPSGRSPVHVYHLTGSTKSEYKVWDRRLNAAGIPGDNL